MVFHESLVARKIDPSIAPAISLFAAPDSPAGSDKKIPAFWAPFDDNECENGMNPASKTSRRSRREALPHSSSVTSPAEANYMQ
jgi:hypothetical protein